MGCRILQTDEGEAVLYCSTVGWAFGPIFHGGYDEAEAFLQWIGLDPRSLNDKELEKHYCDWGKLAWCDYCAKFVEDFKTAEKPLACSSRCRVALSKEAVGRG